MAFLFGEDSVGGDRSKQSGRQGCVDAFEELQKQDADPVALRTLALPAGVRDLLDKPLGTQLREIVPQRRQAILIGIHVECGNRRGV